MVDIFVSGRTEDGPGSRKSARHLPGPVRFDLEAAWNDRVGMIQRSVVVVSSKPV